MNNWLGLLLAYLYIFGVIAAAQLLRRLGSFSSDFTRKFIHIGVGMLIWVVPLLFDTPWFFVFASFTFVVINLVDFRYGLISAMTSSDRSNLGTVYFPIAAAVVAIVLWDYPPLMVAALMPLTWGDGLAAVIGRSYGRHTYTVFGQRRSIEGSMAFFLVGGLFTWLALWMVAGDPELSPQMAFVPALVVISVTTITEAISTAGLDNLTISGVALVILYLWPF